MGRIPGRDAGREPSAGEARNIELLRRLVTGLAVVMALGMLVIVGLMVMRLVRVPPLPLPETLEFPEGARAQAITVTGDWYLVVTETGAVLVYERETGRLRQELQLD